MLLGMSVQFLVEILDQSSLLALLAATQVWRVRSIAEARVSYIKLSRYTKFNSYLAVLGRTYGSLFMFRACNTT